MRAMARSLDPVGAAELLAVLADSLTNNPSQFQYSINVHIGEITGLKSGSGPVTSQAISNAPAQNVIGGVFQAGFGEAEMGLVRGQADAAFQERMHDAAKLIREMTDLLADSDNEDSVNHRFNELAALTLPAVVIEMVKTILEMAKVLN